MKRLLRSWQLALLFTAASLTAAPAWADPPSRVARLNYIRGDVSFRPATLDDWAPATLNYPLTTGDHLWTDRESWAEMHVGSTAIRLAPQTAFAFLNLDDSFTQLRLSEGALDVRVRHTDGSDGIEINTPSAAIALLEPGVYRVDVLPDGGSTRVTVRAGVAEVIGDTGTFRVRRGEAAAVYGDGVSHEIFLASAPDSWERWCRDRDAREENSASLRHVSYEMTGYEDLDDYGVWRSEPDYGWVWQPTAVSIGWAPYRHGHWRWVDPWGWTWIDDAPWGFAPFHYGRWACLRGSTWVWVPGGYVQRPVYAPALVAFIGGDRWGVSLGFGAHNALAWFPLAPGELWVPYYRASHVYIRNLNITHVHVTNINIYNHQPSRGTYVNRAIAGAVTAVPRDAFVGGHAVARSAFRVQPRDAMTSDVLGSAAPVVPRAESVLGRGGRATARPTSASLERAVVARTTPPSAPVPFQARARALEANGARPLDDSALAAMARGERSTRSASAPVRIAGARGGRTGDRARRTDPDPTPDESPGSGGALRRMGERGERLRTESAGAEATESARPAERPASELNDRPSWAERRGSGAARPSNPGYYGGTRATPRSEESAGERGETPSNDRPPNDRPAYGAAPGARPRLGDRGTTREVPSESADRPTRSDRPWSGESSRPGGAMTRPGWRSPDPDGSSRPSPGYASPSPSDRPSGSFGGSSEGARPRWGDRPSSGDRPPAAPRSYGGDSQPSSAPTPAPEGRPSPGGERSIGGARPSGGSESRPAGPGMAHPRGGGPGASSPPPSAAPSGPPPSAPAAPPSSRPGGAPAGARPRGGNGQQ